eukprot:5145798-Pyramimonas_sp.AAC.1
MSAVGRPAAGATITVHQVVDAVAYDETPLGLRVLANPSKRVDPDSCTLSPSELAPVLAARDLSKLNSSDVCKLFQTLSEWGVCATAENDDRVRKVFIIGQCHNVLQVLRTTSAVCIAEALADSDCATLGECRATSATRLVNIDRHASNMAAER